MSKYLIHNIACLPGGDEAAPLMEQGFFLLVLNALKKPPHLVLMVRGKPYSLTVNGPKMYGSHLEIQKLIRAKKIPTLYFQLRSPKSAKDSELLGLAEQFTFEHSRAGSDNVTCLYPLKKFCEAAYCLDISRVHFIFDLLPLLFNDLLITASYQMHMNHYLVGGTYAMEQYSMDDVHDAIHNYQMIPTS